MEKFYEAIKYVFCLIATAVTYLFGGTDTAVIVLVTFLALDYFLGIAIASAKKEVSSKKGRRGLLKKAAILAVFFAAVLLDRLIGNQVFILRTTICYFYIANEGISILENCALLGVPIPKKILDVLIQIKGSEKTVKAEEIAEHDETE